MQTRLKRAFPHNVRCERKVRTNVIDVDDPTVAGIMSQVNALLESADMFTTTCNTVDCPHLGPSPTTDRQPRPFFVLSLLCGFADQGASGVVTIPARINLHALIKRCVKAFIRTTLAKWPRRAAPSRTRNSPQRSLRSKKHRPLFSLDASRKLMKLIHLSAA